MTGPVRAEAAAVHVLAEAVSRYAQHVHNLSRAARAAADREVSRMEQIAERRRQALNQANQKLADAQAALNACLGNPMGMGCGAFAAAVDAAQAAQDRAQTAYDNAVSAASSAAAAARELSAVISAVETVVAGQSSVAVAALRDLQHRLHQVGDFIRANWVAGAMLALSCLDVGHVAIKITDQFIEARDRVTIGQYEAAWHAEQVELGLAERALDTERLNDAKDRAIRGDQ
jgi:hypothetical protein